MCKHAGGKAVEPTCTHRRQKGHGKMPLQASMLEAILSAHAQHRNWVRSHYLHVQSSRDGLWDKGC